jgi:hypothetical protein
MRTLRPRRLGQDEIFDELSEPADLTDNFAKSAACSFMRMVRDFSVNWISEALVQVTSVIVPTME